MVAVILIVVGLFGCHPDLIVAAGIDPGQLANIETKTRTQQIPAKR